VTDAGHEPLILSRSTGIDLLSGTGLASVIRDAHVVIDVSATSSTSTKQAVQFFGTVTRNLLDAEREAGVSHHVAISVIGASKIDANYYAGKAAQERLLTAQARGWSLLRTTQFHEFVQQLVRHGRLGPLQFVPSMRTQPIAAAEVAAELVAIAAGAPRGVEPDLAGPQEERMANLVKRYLDAIGQSRPVLQVSIPGAWGRGMRDGSLLPGRGTRLGQQTFTDWLAGIAA
jgi:uncharacterized protein YbjT (DUF2867 family)